MRSFREPSAKNLLREPMVLGVPFVVLVGLTLVTLGGLVVFGDSSAGGMSVSLLVSFAYLVARIFQHFARPGWTESAIFVFERSALRKVAAGPVRQDDFSNPLEVTATDTLETEDLCVVKHPFQEELAVLRRGDRYTVVTEKTSAGYRSEKHLSQSQNRVETGRSVLVRLREYPVVYSLHTLPTVTTPQWLYEALARVSGDFVVVSAFQGVSAHRTKERIEVARRRNARMSRVSSVDSDVAFAEATQVLEGIARGDDSVLEGALVIAAKEELELDPRYFCRETSIELPVFAISGIRNRFHRSHTLRAVTGSDLILNLGDPYEAGGTAILATPRGLPLYFNPQDSRLEALHWLVTAASGAGKSFFVGLVLLRLVRAGSKASVLFVDHNRSFRRVTRGAGRGEYVEPASFDDLSTKLKPLVSSLGNVGTIAGIELSDLAVDEKRAAIRILLSEVERWLRARDTVHPVYLVLDECWNFMRDEPLLVQRAFREFRKLNGAAIAITQSLSDFLMDESGRAIFQNAPIRILLRQAEDLEPYRGVLGLNDVELKKLRSLRQKKGEFSECLIKTPFLSRVGRLYPSPEEHELLRTDNIRDELVRESLSARDLHSPAREARC